MDGDWGAVDGDWGAVNSDCRAGGVRVPWMHPRAGPSVSELSTEGCTEPRLINHMVRMVTSSRGSVQPATPEGHLLYVI